MSSAALIVSGAEMIEILDDKRPFIEVAVFKFAQFETICLLCDHIKSAVQ